MVPMPKVASWERCATRGSETTGQGTRLGGTADTPTTRNPRAIRAPKITMTPAPTGLSCSATVTSVAALAPAPNASFVLLGCTCRSACAALTRAARRSAFGGEIGRTRFGRRAAADTVVRAGVRVGGDDVVVAVVSGAGGGCVGDWAEEGGGDDAGGGGGGCGLAVVCRGFGSGACDGGLGFGAGPVVTATLAEPTVAKATEDPSPSAQTIRKPRVVAIPMSRERGGAAPARRLIRGC